MEEKKIKKKKLTLSISGKKPHNVPHYAQGRGKTSFVIEKFKPSPPVALSSGQYSFEYLAELFSVYDKINNFNDFHIPFRCNATDILSNLFSNSNINH